MWSSFRHQMNPQQAVLSRKARGKALLQPPLSPQQWKSQGQMQVKTNPCCPRKRKRWITNLNEQQSSSSAYNHISYWNTGPTRIACTLSPHLSMLLLFTFSPFSLTLHYKNFHCMSSSSSHVLLETIFFLYSGIKITIMYKYNIRELMCTLFKVVLPWQWQHLVWSMCIVFQPAL